MNKEVSNLVHLLANESEKINPLFYERTQRINTEEISRWNDNENYEKTPITIKFRKSTTKRYKIYEIPSPKLSFPKINTTEQNSSTIKQKPLPKNIQPSNIIRASIINLFSRSKNKASPIHTAASRIKMNTTNKEKV